MWFITMHEGYKHAKNKMQVTSHVLIQTDHFFCSLSVFLFVLSNQFFSDCCMTIKNSFCFKNEFKQQQKTHGSNEKIFSVMYEFARLLHIYKLSEHYFSKKICQMELIWEVSEVQKPCKPRDASMKTTSRPCCFHLATVLPRHIISRHGGFIYCNHHV